jgi:hypothetical protein
VALYHEGVDLVRTWRRGAARAAGATLIVPAVLLLAAVLLAAGGGFGNIGSLGQIAAGPSVPPAELAANRATPSSPSSDVAALERDLPSATPRRRSSAARGGATRRGSGSGGQQVVATPNTGTPVSRTPSPTQPGGGRRPTTPTQAPTPAPVQAPTGPQLRPPSSQNNPGQQFVQHTNGLGQQLQAPLTLPRLNQLPLVSPGLAPR